ncbi:hypothetical protein QTP88_025194 [Uroleucon formosanum]
MTREIFTSWLKDWDKELGKQSRNILLIVDNAGPHPKLIDLKNIALEFLPPNTTSLVQPLDMGIIKNLKTHYHGLLVTYILKAIEDNLVTPSTCAIDIGSKINILQAIQFVADSWRKVSSVTIQHCFTHCGFRPLIDLPIHPIISIESYVAQCVGNGELFIKIDDGVQYFNENENYDNIIVEIAERSLQNEESDNDDDDVEPVKITKRGAEKCIDQLRLYFMQNENGNASTTSKFVEKIVCSSNDNPRHMASSQITPSVARNIPTIPLLKRTLRKARQKKQKVPQNPFSLMELEIHETL